MAARLWKRRRKRVYRTKNDHIVEDLTEGIKINGVSETRNINKKSYSFSLYDHPGMMMIYLGSRMETAGIFRSPQYANSHKSIKINKYKHRIKDW